MTKQTLLAATFLCLALTAAQSQSRLNNDTKGIIYNDEKAIDIRVHTHGWAANFMVGKIKSYYKTTFYRFGLGELRHFKEVSESTDYSAFSPGSGFRQYIFGKQNYGFVLRGGYGVKRYYTEKASKKGVALAVTYSGGATLALKTLAAPRILYLSRKTDAVSDEYLISFEPLGSREPLLTSR